MSKLFFFGCIGNQIGHYWSGTRSHSIHIIANDLKCNEQIIRFFDGTYMPINGKQSVYQYSQIGHIQIVSWIDNSVDSRPGSNSNLIGTGFSSPEEMIDEGIKLFPNEMNRQPRPKPDLISEELSESLLLQLGWKYYNGKNFGDLTRDTPCKMDIDWIDGKLRIKSHYESAEQYRVLPIKHTHQLKQFWITFTGEKLF